MRSAVLLVVFAGATVLAGNVVQAQTTRGDNPFLFAPELRSGGSYLGVSLADIDADRASALKLGEPRGVEVTKVEEGSPAANAGLRAGDVLLNYNGENVLGAQHLARLVQETPAARKIRVQFWRDGRMQSTTVTTGAPQPHGLVFPQTPGDFKFPELRNLAIAEFPTPLLVWKNSMLGIECEPVDSQLAQYFGVKRGVLVRSVQSGSAAEKAGVKAGDVVTAIGDRTVANPRDLNSFMRTQHHSGTAVSLALVRDHKGLTLSVVPSEEPE